VVEVPGVPALRVMTRCVLPEVSVEEQAEKVGDTGREFSETSVLASGQGDMVHATGPVCVEL
jgi:hypothetical protein